VLRECGLTLMVLSSGCAPCSRLPFVSGRQVTPSEIEVFRDAGIQADSQADEAGCAVLCPSRSVEQCAYYVYCRGEAGFGACDHDAGGVAFGRVYCTSSVCSNSLP
jgi:hypothetical protein